MKPAETRALLEAIYRDKLALRQRHVAAARRVSAYEANNAYQYVINREDVHLEWLRDAVAAAGGTLADVPLPEVTGDLLRHHGGGSRERGRVRQPLEGPGSARSATRATERCWA